MPRGLSLVPSGVLLLSGALIAPSACAGPAPGGTPPAGPGSPAAVLDLGAGGALLYGSAVAADLDVETRPFISHRFGLRAAMGYVARSFYRQLNPAQLGASLQVTAGLGRVELALGWITLQNTDTYNSGRLNVDATVDVAVTAHWRLRLQHWSNAESVRPNIGRDMALIVYRF